MLCHPYPTISFIISIKSGHNSQSFTGCVSATKSALPVQKTQLKVANSNYDSPGPAVEVTPGSGYGGVESQRGWTLCQITQLSTQIGL